jgi:hypothetical protein
VIVRSRRLTTTLALAIAAGGISIAVASPAQAAAPMNCGQVASGITVTSTYITASYYVTCEGPDAPKLYIYKNGAEVASGSGLVIYDCVGSAENSFSVTGYAPFEAACG